jgi:hypothetical protein
MRRASASSPDCARRFDARRHPRVAISQSETQDRTQTCWISFSSQPLRRPPQTAKARTRPALQGRRRDVEVHRNDRCQLGASSNRAGNSALAKASGFPWLPSPTGAPDHWRAPAAPPRNGRMVPEGCRSSARYRCVRLVALGIRATRASRPLFGECRALLDDDPRPVPSTLGERLRVMAQPR